MRRARPLFPINVWPPLVDAMTLVLAAFALIVVIAALGEHALVGRLRDKERELDKLREEKARVERRLRALAPSGTFEVEEGKVILQGEVLFASGSDEVRAESHALMSEMARALSALLVAEPEQMILIGGHTDNVPIKNARFDSNWELSAARAVAVARVLIAAGLPPERVTAAGFGEHHPRGGNDDEASRRRNRRIEVLVVPVRAVSSR
ncbi:MAG: OmpA family protein [Polyangia bacterium]